MSRAFKALYALALTRLWRCSQRLGLAGVLGLVAWGLSACGICMALLQTQRMAKVELPKLQATVVIENRPGNSPEWFELPRDRDLPIVIASMQEACRKIGLVWPQAEYHQLEKSQDQLAQVEVQTSVSGSYPQIRAWVELLLGQYPALALRGWVMERSNVDVGTIEAKLTWVLYVRGPEVTP